MKKYFGSKIPILNFVFSKLLFLGFNGRLKYLYFRNKLKESKRNKEITLVNDENTRKLMGEWLEKGYNKINIGGGKYNLEGFINIDFVKFKEVEKGVVANILDLSFIPDNSIDYIYSNQVMEHLTEKQLLDQFQQYKRILKKGGKISFRTPNTLGVCYGFWFGQVPEDNRKEFLELGYPKDAFFYDSRDGWYHKDLFALVHWIYADAGNIRNQHLIIFTPTKVRTYLESAGFKILKMTAPETSQIIVIAKVDEEENYN